MGLADTFQQVLDSLPDDWTDLEFDLRIFDEQRYIEAATYLVTCNAQPYSEHDWHWRIIVAHRFGHGAAPEETITIRVVNGHAYILAQDLAEPLIVPEGCELKVGGEVRAWEEGKVMVFDDSTDRALLPGSVPTLAPESAFRTQADLLLSQLLVGEGQAANAAVVSLPGRRLPRGDLDQPPGRGPRRPSRASVTRADGSSCDFAPDRRKRRAARG